MTNFDKYWGDYREIHNLNLKKTCYTSEYFAERKIREIIKQLKRNKEADKKINILDLGCGDGLCAFYMKKYLPKAFIYGLDVSRESIITAKEKNLSDTKFLLFDGATVPYSNDYFDVILIAGVLHHIIDNKMRIIILQECYRVLRRGGKLFIFEHNPFNPITVKIVNDCIFDKDAKLINHYEMKNIVSKMDFKIRTKFIIFFPGIFRKYDFLETLFQFIPLGGQYCIAGTKT